MTRRAEISVGIRADTVLYTADHRHRDVSSREPFIWLTHWFFPWPSHLWPWESSRAVANVMDYIFSALDYWHPWLKKKRRRRHRWWEKCCGYVKWLYFSWKQGWIKGQYNIDTMINYVTSISGDFVSNVALYRFYFVYCKNTSQIMIYFLILHSPT